MIKIALTGPESTGKTELCIRLAEHFQAVYEPELAREYVEKLGYTYTYEDVCTIARLQTEQEKQYATGVEAKPVFFDTDVIITKVWLEYKYGQVPAFVTEHISGRLMDFYLLCEPDLPWVSDPVREHGDDREFFFDWYEREINRLGTSCVKINGTGEMRFLNALKAVEDFLATKGNRFLSEK
ncbi:MAG: metabolism ATPase/kinase-like protein [Bacteroidetes bacterium]|nr:metabolism ATPase/kinase-like protein [Bacteroidota bacterium]